MANYRFVNTQVWKDPWFVELRLTEQHLWLYLLTNPQTNMLGVYELSLREMAFDTSIDKDEVIRIFQQRFEPDGKAYYAEGWVVMKNWLKHQTPNPNQLTAMVNKFNALPLFLREVLLDENDDLYLDLIEKLEAFPSLSKAYSEVTHKRKENKIILNKRANSYPHVDKQKQELANRRSMR